MRIFDVLEFLIEKGPGRTTAQLAEAIFGRSGYRKKVNSDCRRLVWGDRVERRGAGTNGDPYRYFPKAA